MRDWRIVGSDLSTTRRRRNLLLIELVFLLGLFAVFALMGLPTWFLALHAGFWVAGLVIAVADTLRLGRR